MNATINGAELSWQENGEGDPVVFIHGFPFHSGLWADQLSAMPAGFRGIAPDLRGFGESSAPGRGPLTMDQHADDVVGLMDHLGIRQAVICGLSMGGYVAFSLFRRHRSRVRALVLAATRSAADSAEAKQGRTELAKKVLNEGTSVVVESMLPKLLSDITPKTKPEVVDAVRALMEANNPEPIARALEGMASRDDSSDLLREIDISTLVIHGEDDLVIPKGEAQLMARGIRGARIELLERAGHVLNMEDPATFNRLLKEFLDNLPLTFELTTFQLER